LPFLTQRSFNRDDKDCKDLRVLLYRFRQKPSEIRAQFLGTTEAERVLLTNTLLILFPLSMFIKNVGMVTTFSIIVT